MKKFILGLGTLASTVAPVATVVACGVDSETGLPTFTDEEQEKISSRIVKALGMLDTTKGLFKFAITKFDKATGQIGMTLTRTNVSGNALFGAILNNSSGTSLTMLEGEELNISLAIDVANNMKITETTFILKNSKIESKNIEYSTSLTEQNIKTIFFSLTELLIPIKSSLTLTREKALKALPVYSNVSAQSFFGVPTVSSEIGHTQDRPVNGAKFNYSLSMEKKTFDFTFELQNNPVYIALYGEDGNRISNEDTTTVSTITFHFIGTFTLKTSSTPAHYTFTKREGTISQTGKQDQKVTLNETGSSEMTNNLMSIVFGNA